MKNLEAISKMVDNDQDVRLTNTLVEVKKVKAGGLITFGVDANTFDLISRDFMSSETNEYLVFAMVVNNSEMKEILKNETS